MSSDNLYILHHLTIPGRELQVQVSTSGGPGGQHANKTSTRVSLRWNIVQSQVLATWQRNLLLEKLGSRLTNAGELIIHADDSRSQSMNHQRARERLTELVQKSLTRPKSRKPTRPSRSAKKRRMDNKKRRGDVKRSRQKYRGED